MRPLVATLAISLLVAPHAVRAADALDFGVLSATSTLGQPFVATFTIDAGSASAVAKLTVKLADADAYSARRAQRDAALSQLRFEVVARKGGVATVKVSSAEPMREPSLDLVIEARTGAKLALQEYTVLLDPPPSAAPAPTSPTAGSAEVAGAEFAYELDLYYTNISVEIPLTNKPMPNGGWLSEQQVYSRLFKESLRPQLLLLEASVYPMPVLGTYVKEHSPETYDKFTIGGSDSDINLLDGLTAGFQEPWAISAFVGSAMKFSRDDKQNKGVNKGYMGYLVSYGAKHIHQNVLIDDDWWEFEWKLKGERAFEDEDLSWSFFLGTKSHGNPDIADTLYFGGRRTNVDFKRSWLGWLENSSFEYRTELAQDNFSFLRQDLVIGKRFPSKDHKWAFSLDVGLVYEKDSKYTGPLFDPTADNVTIVFRPNIVF